MDFTGQRDEKQKQFIKINHEKNVDKFLVKSKQPFINKMVANIINIFMWSYMIIILYFFISAFLNYNNEFIGLLKISFKMTNQDIRMFILLTFNCFFIFCSILLSWKFYNKNKFGQLNRRLEPKQTIKEDMLALNLMDEETYDLLFKEKVIIFEKNPLKELERAK